jgi:hypothetical protein
MKGVEVKRIFPAGLYKHNVNNSQNATTFISAAGIQI